jgi:hypothetical protein
MLYYDQTNDIVKLKTYLNPLTTSFRIKAVASGGTYFDSATANSSIISVDYKGCFLANQIQASTLSNSITAYEGLNQCTSSNPCSYTLTDFSFTTTDSTNCIPTVTINKVTKDSVLMTNTLFSLVNSGGNYNLKVSSLISGDQGVWRVKLSLNINGVEYLTNDVLELTVLPISFQTSWNKFQSALTYTLGRSS